MSSDHQRDTAGVSILVPAFRATFLDAALASAVAQSWPQIEIIVSDDCPDDTVADVVAKWMELDDRIRYVRNEPANGPRRNPIELVRLASRDYVKFLNDDDLLDPRCAEHMASVLRDHPEVALVTSHRALIDERGDLLPPIVPTLRPVIDDSIVPGREAIASLLGRRVNWIGEPTTTMFRRLAIGDPETLFSFGGRDALANADVTLWVRLLATGDLCYLTESLSSFRQHEAQGQRDPEFLDRAHAGWDQIIVDAVAAGLPTNDPGPLPHRPLDERPWWSTETMQRMVAADELLDRGEAAAALEELAIARSESDGDPSVVVLEAALATALDQVSRSIELLTPLLVARGDRIPALLGLADAADAMGRHADAQPLRQRAAQLVPGSAALASAAAVGSVHGSDDRLTLGAIA